MKRFVELARNVDGDINVAHDKYVVDGKSLLGLMSLDLSKPIKVTVISDNDYGFNEFMVNCVNWIVGK